MIKSKGENSCPPSSEIVICKAYIPMVGGMQSNALFPLAKLATIFIGKLRASLEDGVGVTANLGANPS
jgi:hypothetical protein